MNSAATKITELIESFAMCDTWEDRYAYLIELGKDLPQYPETARDDAHLVQGCMSQVWLCNKATESAQKANIANNNHIIELCADSDAAIVRGLLSVLLQIVNGAPASVIRDLDLIGVFEKIGLASHLTSQRANGLRSVIAHIKHETNN